MICKICKQDVHPVIFNSEEKMCSYCIDHLEKRNDKCDCWLCNRAMLWARDNLKIKEVK